MSNASRRTARSSVVRLVFLALAVVGLLLAASILPVGDYLGRLLQYLQSLGPVGPLVMAAVYVVATVFMVPGTILTLTAGFAFGLAVGTITVLVGSVLGALAAFLVGRTVARDFVEQKMAEYPRFAAIQRAVEQSGLKVVLLARLSPLFPFNVLNYLFSVTKVRTGDYVLGSLIGMFPAIVMYVYFGTAAKNAAQIARGQFEGGPAQGVLFGIGMVATIVVTAVVTREARKALRQYDAAPDS